MRPRRIFPLLLLFVAVAAASAAFLLNRPYAGFAEPVFVDLPKGTSTRRMAQMLSAAGVIRGPWEFLAVRLIERGRTLQAGEYQFRQPATPFQVFDRIARGDIFYLELVVPEGLNMFDIADLAGKLEIFPSDEFLRAARDPGLIRDLDPQAPSLEG